jgi:hypothetical protein
MFSLGLKSLALVIIEAIDTLIWCKSLNQFFKDYIDFSYYIKK